MPPNMVNYRIPPPPPPPKYRSVNQFNQLKQHQQHDANATQISAVTTGGYIMGVSNKESYLRNHNKTVKFKMCSQK